jgi:biopolymer transport protein ExbB/TolQ
MNANLRVIPDQGAPMSEQTETIFGVLGVIGVAGWSVMQWLQRTDKERHEDLKDAIEKQFAAAEQNRQQATGYWKEMFTEMRDGHAEIAERLTKLEERVADVEMELMTQDEPTLNRYRST